jgi:hypothetical protein
MNRTGRAVAVFAARGAGLHSAVPEEVVRADLRTEFETWVGRAPQPPEPGPLIEDVAVSLLLGRG